MKRKKRSESYLPALPAGCPCPDDGPILAAPPKTSPITNQYICIFFITLIIILISRVHVFTFKCSTFYTTIQ